MKFTIASAFVSVLAVSSVNASPQFFTTNSGTGGTTTCITFTFSDASSTWVSTSTLPPSPTTTARPTTTLPPSPTTLPPTTVSPTTKTTSRRL